MVQKKADTQFKVVTPQEIIEKTSGGLVEQAPEEAKVVSKPEKRVLGFEWSKLPDVDEELELCLWNADVTDIDDINKKPQRVFAALQAYLRVHLGALRAAVKEYKANVK